VTSHSDHGQSTSYAHTEREQVQVLNEVLDDENTGEFSSDNDSIFISYYTQFVTPGNHVISDSESDNGNGEQEEENRTIKRSARYVFLTKYRLISHLRRNILWRIWSPVQR
jgi:hypothetical protein